MKIERVMRYAITPAAAYAMATSKEFQQRKCVDAGALSYEVTIWQAAEGTVVKTRRRLPTTDFPTLLRRFVPSSVTSTETITWTEAAVDGARTGRIGVDFHGAPASFTGTLTIAPDGPELTRIVLAAEFRAHVPLIAARVEAIAAPIIISVIDSEESTGQAWLAESH